MLLHLINIEVDFDLYYLLKYNTLVDVHVSKLNIALSKFIGQVQDDEGVTTVYISLITSDAIL